MTPVAALFSSILLTLLLTISPARADTLVDSSLTGGAIVNAPQSVAGQFILTSGYNITDIYGSISGVASGTYQLTAAIYGSQAGDAGSCIPDPTTTFFTRQFSSYFDAAPAWHGVSGLNLTINPGTYWLSFEVGPGDNLADLTDATFNFIIMGEEISLVPIPTPEPASLALLLAGAAGMAALRRCRRR